MPIRIGCPDTRSRVRERSPLEPSREGLTARILGTFNEMPGLQLRLAQATRLFGVSRAACIAVLDDLVANGSLARAADGQYRVARVELRVSREGLPTPAAHTDPLKRSDAEPLSHTPAQAMPAHRIESIRPRQVTGPGRAATALWRSRSPRRGPSASEGGTARPTVLLLEGDPDTTEMYTVGLEAAGFQPRVATDATDVRRQLRGAMPLAVVIETHPRPTEQSALLSDLNRDPRTREIPVAIVTDRFDDALALLAGTVSHSAVLLKPCLPDVLASVLRMLCVPQPAGAASADSADTRRGLTLVRREG